MELVSSWAEAVGAVTVLPAAVMAIHHMNCHAPHCPRPGRHPYGSFKYCHRHLKLATTTSGQSDQIAQVPRNPAPRT